MISRQKLDWLLYAIIFQTCQLLGVLPLSWKPIFSSSAIQFNNDYSVISRKRTFTAVHILLCMVSAHHMAPKFSDLKTVSPLAALWLTNWSSALSILSLSLCSHTSLADCFSRACHIYHTPTNHFIPLPLKLFFFMTLYPFAPFVYAFSYMGIIGFKFVIKFALFNYAYVSTGIISALVSTFCLMAQNLYSNINRDLNQLVFKRMKRNIMPCLTHKLEQYLIVAKFVASFAKYFGPYFLIIFLSSTFRLIIYALLVVQLRKVGNVHDFLACAAHSFYFIFWLLFLCYRIHRVQEEAAETRSIVRKLQVQWISQLTEEQVELVLQIILNKIVTDTYEELMEAVAVKFTACGFFPVSLGQVLNILGLTITYGLLAALQS